MSLHKRSDKKEAVDCICFICALSAPLHSRVLLLKIYPPKESHNTMRHRARARARNPAQKRPFHATKTLALTVFHVYFHHALRSVLHVKGMENHLISNLMKLCDSTNHVTCYWTLVFSVVLSARYLNLFRLLIGQLEYSFCYNDHSSKERNSNKTG